LYSLNGIRDIIPGNAGTCQLTSLMRWWRFGFCHHNCCCATAVVVEASVGHFLFPLFFHGADGYIMYSMYGYVVRGQIEDTPVSLLLFPPPKYSATI